MSRSFLTWWIYTPSPFQPTPLLNPTRIKKNIDIATVVKFIASIQLLSYILHYHTIKKPSVIGTHSTKTDPPPLHCMPPHRSIIGFLLHPIQILNTPHSTTGLVSLQFLCAASYYLACIYILKYERFKLQATQALMCSLHDQSISSRETLAFFSNKDILSFNLFRLFLYLYLQSVIFGKIGNTLVHVMTRK